MRVRSRIFLLVLVALFLVSCLWAAVYHLTVEALPYDDAYITFRYADHLAGGEGLVYNTGVRVFGSSSPLYTLWLALLKFILPRAATPDLAVRTNLIFFLLTSVATVGVVRAVSGSSKAALLSGIVFTLHPDMLSISSGGMESFLFVSLVLCAVWACLRGRHLWGGGAAGLSVLARPEGVLVIVALAAGWWLAGRGRPILFLTLLLAPGAAWALVATWYFGTPIPHSLVAKMAPLYPLPPGHSLLILRRWLVQWMLPLLPADRPSLIAFPGLLITEVGALGLILDERSRRRGGWMVALLLNLFVIFYAAGNPLFFDWYAANVFPFWMLSILLGLPALARRLSARRPGAVWAPGLVTAACALAVASSAAIPHLVDLTSGVSPWERIRTATRLRTVGYRDAALWLNDHAPAESSLATAETGAIGYFWRGRVIDACGLVSPEAIPFLPVPPEKRADPMTAALPVGLIEATRPEFVATLQVFSEKSLLTSEWFKSNYQPLHEVLLPKSVWGSQAVLLFRRADVSVAGADAS